jgi:thiol-disulfide isomerase/thioredoxin
MKYLFFFNFLVTLSINTVAQNQVIIKGYSEDYELEKISISPPLRDCINGWVPLNTIPIDSTHHFYKAIPITHAGLIYIHCNDYMEAFVKPGDTLNLEIKKLDKPVMRFDGTLQEEKEYKGKLSGSHVWNNFFSDLEEKTGKMNSVSFLIDNDLTKTEKSQKITDLYNQRIAILKVFINNHPETGQEFGQLVSDDIKGQYFSKLYRPGQNISSLPETHFDEIKNEYFTFDRLSKSQYLMASAYFYFINYSENQPAGNYSGNDLDLEFNNIIHKVKDQPLKNYLLTALMTSFLTKDTYNYQEMVTRYNQLCVDKSYKARFNIVYNNYLNKPIPLDLKLSDLALSSKVFNNAGAEYSLRDVLKSSKAKVILIDFWASWCGPCIVQIPYLKQLEKKYDGKLGFISLSEDRSNKDWLIALQQHDLYKNQYKLNLIDKSALIKDLKITTIPRFILIKSDGTVINAALPKPMEQEHIEKIIDAELSKK